SEQTRPMYLSFFADGLDQAQVTDYVIRVVEPQLATIPGVERAEFLGGRGFAIRVWLKTDLLAARNLTPSEVYTALRNQNFLSALGETKGNFVKFALTARTELRTPEEFRSLVVKSDGDRAVHLGDVAEVQLGAESYEESAFWNAKPALFI